MKGQPRWEIVCEATGHVRDTALQGDRLLLGGAEGLSAVDIDSGKVLHRAETVHRQGISRLAVSPRNTYVCSLGAEGKAVIWTGAELEPVKKFAMGASLATTLCCEFSSNETTLVVAGRKEFVVIRLRGDKAGKEVRRVPLKEEELEAACCIWELKALAGAETRGQLALFSFESAERLFVLNALGSVSFLRSFGDGKLWCAYQRNLLGIYLLTGEEDRVAERRTPFEILDIQRLSDKLYVVSGLGETIGVMNAAGAYLYSLHVRSGAVIARGLCWDEGKRRLFVCFNGQTVEAIDVKTKTLFFLFNELSFRTYNGCQLEVVRETGSVWRKKYDFTGRIISIHFCPKSWLAVLIETWLGKRLHLLDAAQIGSQKRSFPARLSDRRDWRTSAALRGSALDSTIEVFVFGPNLLLWQFSELMLVDLQLKPLRRWNFSEEITALELLGGPPRKESALVAILNGEIFKISADNPFPLPLSDYKLRVERLLISLSSQHLLLLDVNANLTLYALDIGTLMLTSFFKAADVAECCFNDKYPSLFAYRTRKGKIFVVLGEISAEIAADELPPDVIAHLLGFSAKKMFFFENKSGIFYKIESNFSALAAQLLKNNQLEELLRMQVAVGEARECLRETCLLCLERAEATEQVLTVLSIIHEHELYHFINGLLQLEAGELSPKALLWLRAEVLALRGKCSDAVELLLVEGETISALKLLMVLGRYEQGLRVLRSPAGRNLPDAASRLKQLTSLHAAELVATKNFDPAVDAYLTVGDMLSAIKVMILQGKEVELLSHLKRFPSGEQKTAALNIAFEHFERRQTTGLALECLHLVGDSKRLLDFHIKHEQFEEAITLSESMRPLPHPRYVHLPLTWYLLRHGRLEEALKSFSQCGNADEYRAMVWQLLTASCLARQWSLVARLRYEFDRGENSTTASAGAKAALRLAVVQALRERPAFPRGPLPRFADGELAFLALTLLVYEQRKLLLECKAEIEWGKLLAEALETAVRRGLNNHSYFVSELLQDNNPKPEIGSLLLLAKQNKGEDVLFRCPLCKESGMKTDESHCPSCGLQLFHCPLSGEQLPLVPFTVNEEMRIALKASDSHKHFLQQNQRRTEGEEWETKVVPTNFLSRQRENHLLYGRKATLELSSLSQLSEIAFEQFFSIAGRQFYFCEQVVHVCYCRTCLTLFEAAALELVTNKDECPLCRKIKIGFLL